MLYLWTGNVVYVHSWVIIVPNTMQLVHHMGADPQLALSTGCLILLRQKLST